MKKAAKEIYPKDSPNLWLEEIDRSCIPDYTTIELYNKLVKRDNRRAKALRKVRASQSDLAANSRPSKDADQSNRK